MENALLYRLIQNGCDRNQTNTKKYRKIHSFTSETITSCSPFAFFRIPKYNIWRVTLRNYDIPFFPTTSHYTRISYSRDSFYHVGDHGIGRIITFDRESITSAWDRATFCPTQTQYLPSGSAWWLWSAQRQAALEDSLIKLDRRDGQSTSRFPRFSRCYYEICREPRETRLAEPTATTARERERKRGRERQIPCWPERNRVTECTRVRFGFGLGNQSTVLSRQLLRLFAVSLWSGARLSSPFVLPLAHFSFFSSLHILAGRQPPSTLPLER